MSIQYIALGPLKHEPPLDQGSRSFGSVKKSTSVSSDQGLDKPVCPSEDIQSKVETQTPDFGSQIFSVRSKEPEMILFDSCEMQVTASEWPLSVCTLTPESTDQICLPIILKV